MAKTGMEIQADPVLEMYSKAKRHVQCPEDVVILITALL